MPSWVKTEEELVAPTSLRAFLTQMGRLVPFKDPVLFFVQETWMSAHQHIKRSPYLTPKSFIWYNKKNINWQKTYYVGEMGKRWNKLAL